MNSSSPFKNYARFGGLALAAGISYAILRLQKRAQARGWRKRLDRHPSRTALVTGATAGIGQAYVEQLARMGYSLVLVARRVKRLEAAARDIQNQFGTRVEILPADLSTEAGIQQVEERAGEGDIDFLVNNAGYDVFGDFAQIPTEKILGLIRCLQLATVRLTRAALPGMLARRRGCVVNVSSIGAFGPKRRDSVYVASKAFVNRFSESLALELKGSGVRVQALCPGFTLTEFHDAPEYAAYHIKERVPGWLWMRPEQVAAASLQALGENQVVCVPGLMNKGIALAAQIGLSQFLMGILASFFRGSLPAGGSPEPDLSLLACPDCHSRLDLQGDWRKGSLFCARCTRSFPFEKGIPRFTEYAALHGYDRRFAGLYDWFSWVYRLFSKAAFAFIGTSEDEARFEILDRLGPCGKVLEVSIGPGVNLPYLRDYPAVQEIHGLDLSNGQLARCRSFAQRSGWPVSLYQGNAEALPFQDNSFDSVFHVGGINFFNDRQKAILEMIRVAKPGAKIIICDETERGARGYELALPGFKSSFKDKRPPVRPPVDLVPAEMLDVKLDENAWKGWFYCLEFRKPLH